MLPRPPYFCQFQKKHRDQRDRGQSISFIVDKSGIWKAWFISVAKIGLLLSHPKIQLPYQPQAEHEGAASQGHPSGQEGGQNAPSLQI